VGYTSSVYYLEYAEPKPKNLSFSFKAGRGRGRDAKNWKVFGFWTRVKRAPRGALVRITMRAERMIRVRATTRSARTKHATNRFAIENRFELGLKYTHKYNKDTILKRIVSLLYLCALTRNRTLRVQYPHWLFYFASLVN